MSKHVTAYTFGNPAEAARIRESNQKRQQKEAVRPSSIKRETRKAFWELRQAKKQLKKRIWVDEGG